MKPFYDIFRGFRETNLRLLQKRINKELKDIKFVPIESGDECPAKSDQLERRIKEYINQGKG